MVEALETQPKIDDNIIIAFINSSVFRHRMRDIKRTQKTRIQKLEKQNAVEELEQEQNRNVGSEVLMRKFKLSRKRALELLEEAKKEEHQHLRLERKPTPLPKEPKEFNKNKLLSIYPELKPIFSEFDFSAIESFFNKFINIEANDTLTLTPQESRIAFLLNKEQNNGTFFVFSDNGSMENIVTIKGHGSRRIKSIKKSLDKYKQTQ